MLELARKDRPLTSFDLQEALGLMLGRWGFSQALPVTVSMPIDACQASTAPQQGWQERPDCWPAHCEIWKYCQSTSKVCQSTTESQGAARPKQGGGSAQPQLTTAEALP